MSGANSSWEQFGEQDDDEQDLPAITFGDLRDGEAATLTVLAEPEGFHSDDYGPGVRAEVEYVDADYAFTTDDGEAVEEGDEAVLVTWSKRLVRALSEAKADAGGIVGETVTITKHGSGFDTDYSVEVAE
jgi:hypothetical protein